jgi:hypothetical protein
LFQHFFKDIPGIGSKERFPVVTTESEEVQAADVLEALEAPRHEDIVGSAGSACL